MFVLAPTFSLFGCTSTTVDKTVLRVCNCEDYIEESLLDDFTEETGIQVIYSTYGTNENLYNELVINPNSYDLVVPSEYMIEKLAVEGRIQPLDFTKSVSGYMSDKALLSDYDNKIYKTEETVTMPSADVHYTAVWTPALFSVSLYSNNAMKQKITSKEAYTTKMVLPECNYRYYGYKFTGWKYKTEIYQPGDEFEIPALFSGQSVTLSAQWEADESFDKASEIDVFSMVETRRKFNAEKTDENDLKLVSQYVKDNY